MKKKLLYLFLGLFIISVGFEISTTSLFKSKLKTTLSENVSLAKKYKQYLLNSPFKKTLQLTKEQRLAIGIPPNKYYEREWELTMNPATGRPEPNKILELQKKLHNKSYANRVPGDGAAGNDWIERGPNNVGGRTRVVLFDPNDATNKKVYAGGVSGGLWVNQDITNVASTWTLVSGVPSNMNISCITVDPRDSNTWYIGTGEQYTFGAAVGNGVYKTTDGGANWTNIPVQLVGGASFDLNGSNSFLSGLYYINGIQAWDNGTSTEIFIGVGAHLYGDSSSPSDWLGLQNSGLYRSTDNGVNWNRIESTNMQFTFSSKTYYFIPNDFEIGSDNKLWMGMVATPGIGGSGISGGGRVFSSTDGATWTEAAASPLANSNRVELAVSSNVSNPGKIYALTQGTTTDGPHIYSTTDGFATVTELSKPSDADTGIPANDFTRGQDFYDLVIEVDPNNDQTIYVGGIDLFRSTSGTTTNVASKWKQISKWNSSITGTFSVVHADQHAFTFRPGASNEVAIGCDGGVYYASSLSSAPTSNVFTEMNTNYNVTQFYYGGYGQSTSNELIVAGAQDNGSQFINGASPGINSSILVNGGDGAYSTIDKDGNYMIVSYVYSNHTYLSLPYSGTSSSYDIDTNGNEGDFISQAALDHNLNIMYSNGSTTATKQINRYALGSTSAIKTQLSDALLNGSPTAFKVSPFTTASTTLLVGTDNGKLLKLTNANATPAWENISGSSFIGSISAIEYGVSEDEIIVTFHNYGVTSVWFTSNGGTTWKNKEGDLPDMPVKCVLQNPLAPNEVILGTELGIWSTKNFNEDTPNWVSSNNGMRDVKVLDLDLRTADNSILATTHGRGTFTGQFTNATDPTFTIVPTNSIVENCKPADAVYTFNFTTLGGYASSTLFSVSGLPTGATSSFSANNISTTSSITLTISNLGSVTAGNYTLTLTGTGGGKTISKDIVLKVNEATVANTVPSLPVNNSTNIPISGVVFSWNTSLGATSYDIDIATDPAFNTIVESGTSATNSYSNKTNFTEATVYYWRVRGTNFCITGSYSSTQNFHTVPLNDCTSASKNIAVAIPDGVGANSPGAAAKSIINLTNNITISDVNVTIDISHTYIQDLVISLIAPDNTEVVLFNRECAGEDDISVTFDDAGSTITCGTQPVVGIIKPSSPLSTFNGKNSNGSWTLKVVDYYNGDFGSINSWSLETCKAQAITDSSLINNLMHVGVNTTYTILQTDVEASSVGSTATDQQFMITELPQHGDVFKSAPHGSPVKQVLGSTFTQNDINNGKISYTNTSSVSVTDFFEVDITNATSGFLPAKQIKFSVETNLAVDDEFFNKTGISVFPTVSDGNFNVKSQSYIGKTTIELYNISGQRVYKTNLDFNSLGLKQVNANHLSSGVYILRISSNNMQGSKKIIIK
ncbi:proprotein convertase P-domain-containing protein [Lutibacter sp.]|uniref:proprotein convertase P-domain-containing protein n=1 Tax=Lutibacter sp. TaxID=1925666 RepID=UPI0025C73FED|nr:proprotein convertase P-domain-containing protein [Lutibacter sp.]MCF6181553.1 proprotein convertase P-domain-containing protein [Lutibacter sp.]